jgi:hypothetical protein
LCLGLGGTGNHHAGSDVTAHRIDGDSPDC